MINLILSLMKIMFIRMGRATSDLRVSKNIKGWSVSRNKTYFRKGEKIPDVGSIPMEIRNNSSDFSTFQSIFIKEEYRLWDLKRFVEIRDFLENNKLTPLIVDCGANVGFASLYFKLLFPEAKLAIIEPEAKNLEQIKKTLSKFDQKDILLLQNVIMKESGKYQLIDAHGRADAYTFEPSKNVDSQSLDAITLPEVIESAQNHFPDSFPFILKIDIEGHEEGIFDHVDRHVDGFEMVFIEFHDWLYPDRPTANSGLKMLSRLNRSFLVRGENTLSIKR